MPTNANGTDRTKVAVDEGARSGSTGSPIEQADTPPRHGRLLRILTRFVKALQDERQREADRYLANYQEFTRKIKRPADE